MMITNLTDGFWNKVGKQYPKAFFKFRMWVDNYKEKVGWEFLFPTDLKFHYLPYDMQAGIWMHFAKEMLNDCFEQPEYIYHGDLEEDVDQVFKELEEVL